MKQQFDAILKEWSPMRSGDFTILRGAIKGDERDRFRDGEFIRTSAVMGGSFNEGNVIQTRKSRALAEQARGSCVQ